MRMLGASIVFIARRKQGEFIALGEAGTKPKQWTHNQTKRRAPLGSQLGARVVCGGRGLDYIHISGCIHSI